VNKPAAGGGGVVSQPVRAEDWPHGLRCGDCSRLLSDGDHYAERWTGMVGEVPAVLIVCVACAGLAA
jgi:hypothetical protein